MTGWLEVPTRQVDTLQWHSACRVCNRDIAFVALGLAIGEGLSRRSPSNLLAAAQRVRLGGWSPVPWPISADILANSSARRVPRT